MKITFKKDRGQLIPYSDEDYEKFQKMADGAVYTVDIKNIDIRSLKQNSALWLWCTMIADTLNHEKRYITSVIKLDVEWNKDTVKSLIFDPVMNAIHSTDSSTKLSKSDFDPIIDTIISRFGERYGVTIPPFPQIEK